jgi:hypothetical protein
MLTKLISFGEFGRRFVFSGEVADDVRPYLRLKMGNDHRGMTQADRDDQISWLER